MLKKQEILSLPVLDIKAHGRENWVGNVRMLGETIILDVYNSERLMCPEEEEKEAEIKFRWACDGKNFATYLFRWEKWTSKGIYCAMYGEPSYYCHPRIVLDPLSTKLAEEHGIKSWSGSNGSDCLYHLEEKIRQERRDREYDNRRTRIEARVGKRKPLPKDWEKWLGNTVFKAERYLFYDSKARKHGYCAHCNSDVALDGRQRHNGIGKCPVCGSSIQYKAEGKADTMENTKQAIYLQAIPEGFLIRYFKVVKISSTTGEEYKTREQVVETHNGEKTYYDYNLGWYNEEIWNDAKDASWSAWKDKGYLYTRNVKKTLKGTIFAYAPVDIWAKHERKEIGLHRFLEKFKESPFMEYFIKMGLFNLTNDYIRSHYEVWSGRTPQEILGIDNQRIQELVRNDGNKRYLEMLRIEQSQGRKMSEEDKCYVASSEIDMKTIENIAKYTTVTKIRNYIQKNKSYNSIGERETHWADYIHLAEGLGWDMENEIILFPRDLERRHNEAATLANEVKFKERCEEVDKKYTRIPKLKKPLEKKYGYEDEDYMIIVPEKASDFVIEGANLNHCVGRDDMYIESHNQGKSCILFLRKKGREDISFYTLQIKGNQITQYYGYNDKKPEKASVDRFLAEYKTAVLNKKRVRQQVAATA